MDAPVYTEDQPRSVARVIPDLVRSREVLLDLIWKDLRVKYRYAAMGFLWAVLEPVAMMVVLTFVFSHVLQLRGDALGLQDFASSVLCGLVFWQFLDTSLRTATRSLLDNQNLVQKVHFPREIIPLAAVGHCLVNLLIGVLVLIGVVAFRTGSVPVTSIVAPLIFLVQLALVAGLALLFACANVQFRDVAYMVNVALLFGFYATPIFYGREKVETALPDWLHFMYQLNPMVGIVESLRDVLVVGVWPDMNALLWPALAASALLALGVLLFRRSAATIADYL